jgi:RNA-directed DNA polymerase
VAEGLVVPTKSGNAGGGKRPCCRYSFDDTESRGAMRKAPIGLRDLRRRIYVKAKAEPSWRFWGLFVHVCKMETLREAYRAAKKNNGAPGIDGVTFEAIESAGVEGFLRRLRDELVSGTYCPMRNRNRQPPAPPAAAGVETPNGPAGPAPAAHPRGTAHSAGPMT